jgi:hypothetical protein
LEHLNLGHNSIQGKGAFVIADCLSKNTVLKKIDLDGNPVGAEGGRALLRAVCSGIKLQLSFASCNFDISYNNLWDPDVPSKQSPFILMLEDQYDRTLARQLYMFACKHPSFIIESINHEYGDGSSHNINLIRYVCFVFKKLFPHVSQ